MKMPPQKNHKAPLFPAGAHPPTPTKEQQLRRLYFQKDLEFRELREQELRDNILKDYVPLNEPKLFAEQIKGQNHPHQNRHSNSFTREGGGVGANTRHTTGGTQTFGLRPEDLQAWFVDDEGVAAAEVGTREQDNHDVFSPDERVVARRPPAAREPQVRMNNGLQQEQPHGEDLGRGPLLDFGTASATSRVFSPTPYKFGKEDGPADGDPFDVGRFSSLNIDGEMQQTNPGEGGRYSNNVNGKQDADDHDSEEPSFFLHGKSLLKSAMDDSSVLLERPGGGDQVVGNGILTQHPKVDAGGSLFPPHDFHDGGAGQPIPTGTAPGAGFTTQEQHGRGQLLPQYLQDSGALFSQNGILSHVPPAQNNGLQQRLLFQDGGSVSSSTMRKTRADRLRARNRDFSSRTAGVGTIDEEVLLDEGLMKQHQEDEQDGTKRHLEADQTARQSPFKANNAQQLPGTSRSASSSPQRGENPPRHPLRSPEQEREKRRREELNLARCRQMLGFENLCVMVETRAVEQNIKAATLPFSSAAADPNVGNNSGPSSTSGTSCTSDRAQQERAKQREISRIAQEAQSYHQQLLAESDRVFRQAMAEIQAIEKQEMERKRLEKAERERVEKMELDRQRQVREEEERKRRELIEQQKQLELQQQAAAQAEQDRLEKARAAAAEEEKRQVEAEKIAAQQKEEQERMKMKEQQEQLQQANAAQLAQQQQQASSTAAPGTTSKSATTGSSSPGSTTTAFLQQLAQQAKQQEKSLEEFNTSKEKDIRQRRVNLKKAINTKIGQVSHQAPTTVACQKALKELIELSRSSENPTFTEYTRWRISDALCEQWSNIPPAESRLAWPFCYVIVFLIRKLPKHEFRDSFLGMIHHRCPLSIPDLTVADKQAAEEGEGEQEFFNRQTNLLRFYLGSLVLAKDANRLWEYVAALLNSRIPADSSCRFVPFALFCFLEMAGMFMRQRFGHSFLKITQYIRSTWIPHCKEILGQGRDPAPITAKLTVITSWIDGLLKGEDKTPDGMQLQAHGESEIRNDI
ncbi:unnamed protein product [Amoebophrya sp. A120]|nr:unnamed protein product [Amoebophrya sp. A120]|eukprot:GSA120T00009171001.1